MTPSDFQAIADFVAQPMLLVGRDGAIEALNQAARKALGLSEGEGRGRLLQSLVEGPSQLVDAFLRQSARTRSPYPGKFTVKGHGKEEASLVLEGALVGQATDKNLMRIMVRFQPTKQSSVRFALLNEKIAELKAEVRKRRLAEEAAKAANQAKSNFLANISHEIRTPLGAVLGFAELLVTLDQTPPERQHCCEAIKRNGQVLGQMINDILDLSKGEEGHLDVESIDVSVSDVVADISAFATRQAAEKGLRFTISTKGAVPHAIWTDPLRLNKILFNLIGNAIKFTKNGSVGVTLAPGVGRDGRMVLAFTVSDTGLGIVPEQLPRLFEPFSQADASTTRTFGGTGLGLALAKRLAQQLGGDLELVRSVPGLGSSFCLTIALRDHITSQREADCQGTYRSQKTETVAMLNTDLTGVHVLLVDDAIDNQRLISRFLKMAGAKVECAQNGKIALDLYARGHFDIILMDLQMPVMDGYEATAKLRAQGIHLPIVAVTAHAMKEDRKRCLSSGFDAHVSKPVDRFLLQRQIAELLSQRPRKASVV